MPLAQDIYDTLVKDPDLDIGENQTREEAAQTEADFRARQYVNNIRALSLATEPLEKVSPIKALLQHVSSISKTIVSGSISIAQNILKASVDDGMQSYVDEELEHIFEYVLPSLGEKDQKFIKAYIKTQQGNTHHGNAEFIAEFLEEGGTVDFILNAGTSTHSQAHKSLYNLGLSTSPYSATDTPFFTSLKATLSKVVDDNGEQVFPIPYVDFKPESRELGKKKGVDYGTNSSMTLNSTASINNINSALGRQNSPYSVTFGGSQKLKLVNKDGSDLSDSNLYNPFPSGTHGRLFQSMAAFKAPMAGEQNTGHFDATSLSQHSVADILNAVHWISNQETPAQAHDLKLANKESADDMQIAINDDTEMFENEAKINPDSFPPTGTPIATPDSGLSSPHVLVHSHGKVQHKGTEHEYTIGEKTPQKNKFSHVDVAYAHQIVNSHGQLNKLGYALLTKAYESDWIKNGKLNGKYGWKDKKTGVVVVKAEGMMDLLKTHGGIDTDDVNSISMAKELAAKIVGDQFDVNELPDNLIEAATQLGTKTAGGVSTGGASTEVPVKEVEQIEAVGDPDPVGNAALAAKASMQAHAARVQAAYASGDMTSIIKHAKNLQDSMGVYQDHAGTLGDDSPLDTALEGIDKKHHIGIMTLFKHNAPIGSVAHTAAVDKAHALEAEQYPSPLSDSEKTEHLETLKNVAASHLESTPTTAGWDSSLKELHTAMDDAEAAGMDTLEIDTAVKDSMKQIAMESGVQPGALEDFVTTGMPQVNWKADTPTSAEEKPQITIHDPGDTNLSVGDEVTVAEFEAKNEEIFNEGGLPASSNDPLGPSYLSNADNQELHSLMTEVAANETGAVETLNNKIKELKAAGVTPSNIKYGLAKHGWDIGGHTSGDLKDKGVNIPTTEEKPSQQYLENDIADKARAYAKAKGTPTEEQALNILVSAKNGAKEHGLSPEDADKAVSIGLKNYFDEPPEENVPDEPEAAVEEEPPVEPKGKAPEEKLDKVMTAHFGEDWEEQAKTDSDINDVLESYEGEEGQKDLASDYKKHHIDAIKNKAIEAKEGKVTAEEDSKQAAEDKLKEEADSLPSEPDDLDDMAALDEKETVAPETATAQARELLAHQKKHGDNMSSKAKNKLAKGLLNAMKHGADLAKLKKEMVEKGDDFGSPEHLQEAHEKDMKSVEFKNNHEELISGGSGKQAREDAFHAGVHNKFTEFDEDGNPKHDVHIESDENGKAQKFDAHEPKDYKTHEESQKKFHTDKGHALHDSHMLHTMSEKQEEYHDDYKKAKGEYETANAKEEALKADPDSSPEDVQKATSDVNAAVKNFHEKRQTLEDSGVPMKDVANEDDKPKSGPPDPEVAQRKIAQGYVWHEETRHWILKDTLKELQGGHGGHDASVVSSSHGGAAGKSGPFALNEQGNASPGTNFMYHGSGNLMKVGDGKPPTGGSASHSTIAGNALHSQLSSSGHMDAHGNSSTGVTKIPNFTHPTKGSAGSSGIASKASKNVPDSKLGSAMDNLKEGKGLGMTSYLDNLFSKKGYPIPKGSALALFIKAYGSHDAMKHKKEVQELLERVSEGEEESDENSVKKGIISYR